MGVISNLITDMTLRGADEKELARAVKHSMVVIDAEKHGLDYKRSERKMVSQNLSRSGRFVLMRKEMSSTVEHPHFCLVVSKRYEFLNVVEVFMLTKILVN